MADTKLGSTYGTTVRIRSIDVEQEWIGTISMSDYDMGSAEKYLTRDEAAELRDALTAMIEDA
jgi:hypothetical protein